MMNFLLHGDNQTASRAFLQELVAKAKGQEKEIVRLDGSAIVVEDFIQALDSGTMFGGERVVIVENLLSRPRSQEQVKLFGFLEGFGGDNQLILWEKKEIGKLLQKKLPEKTQVKLFKIPALLFKFLDLVVPQKKVEALRCLHELLKLEAAELVFFMLVRQLRLLIRVADGQKIAGPPWIAGKLRRQAEAFQTDRLLTNYRQLFTIDESIKFGQTLMPLRWHLDMFLLNL